MQLHIEGEIIRRHRAPALDHSWFWHGIKRRIDFYQIEMLCVPAEPLASRHFLRIPTLDETGIRPTRCADENFSGFRFARRFFGHTSTKSRRRQKQTHVVRVQLDFRFAQNRHRNYSENAGWSSLVARQAHNLKAAGSNPAPATKSISPIWKRLAAVHSVHKLYPRYSPNYSSVAQW
jgi:hypothetical protein